MGQISVEKFVPPGSLLSGNQQVSAVEVERAEQGVEHGRMIARPVG